MRRLALLVSLVSAGVLAACGAPLGGVVGSSEAPESIGDATWSIINIKGRPVASAGRLTLAGGFINGDGPCNTIRANYIGTLPDFQVEALTTTNRPCPQQALEQELISAMLQARQAVQTGRTLTLSDASGPLLILEAI